VRAQRYRNAGAAQSGSGWAALCGCATARAGVPPERAVYNKL